MTALAAVRNTPKFSPEVLPFKLTHPVKANVVIWMGALVALNASGLLVPFSAATGLTAMGRSMQTVDTTGLADAALHCDVEEGSFYWGNSASSDTLTIADKGKVCYGVDDQTLARTSNGGTRSPAGIVMDVDSVIGVACLTGPAFAALALAAVQAAAAEPAATIQAGTSTLVAGTKTVTGVTITASSRIFITMKDPGAGAITGMGAFDVPVAGRTAGAGTGSFIVNAVDDSKATITTAISTFDYIIVG